MQRITIVVLIFLLLGSGALALEDPHSYCRPQEARVTNLQLKLEADFATKTLNGSASWDIKRLTRVKQIVFDSRDLEIHRVEDGEGRPLGFELGEEDSLLGSPLTIFLRKDTRRVCIFYSTKPQAAALQWASPQQTADEKEPFLYSQSQSIYARSWMPCQDSPSVKFTYKAQIKAPSALMVLMSAVDNPTQKSQSGTYHFTMDRPIPSYLMAIAIGDLKFAALGKRTGIYAEPSRLKDAAWELAGTESMLEAAEELYGPYRWGRYDMLLLPPSFPFGGMENPCLTFLTPTMIAYDRSLVSLVAHELAHSWSGNLVTNASWSDFWLNEGFTNYIERRIVEKLYGRDYVDMEISLGFDSLKLELAEMGKGDSRLKLDLKKLDPDRAMSDIAYEKGYFFLRSIEEKVGRKSFDSFLRAYFNKYAFKSLVSEDLFGELRRAYPGQDFEISKWVYSDGLPASFEVPLAKRFLAVDGEVRRWQEGTPANELVTASWSPFEWLRFLQSLPAGTTAQQMEALDDAFALSKSRNDEVLAQWLMLVIASNYSKGYPALESFLLRVGRLKFIEPLYKEMMGFSDSAELGKEIYAKARSGYHPLSALAIDRLMKP